MKQLVELQKNADKFKAENAEVIVVFREESDGVEGLKKSKQKTKTKFTLAIDPRSKATKAYSPGNNEFDSYVIDSQGIIRGIIDGTKKDRAKAAELLSILQEINSEKASE